MKSDPISEVRKVRMQISEQFNHDPEKYFERLKVLEEKYQATGSYRFAEKPRPSDRLKED